MTSIERSELGSKVVVIDKFFCYFMGLVNKFKVAYSGTSTNRPIGTIFHMKPYEAFVMGKQLSRREV